MKTPPQQYSLAIFSWESNYLNILPVNSFANHERETENDQVAISWNCDPISSPPETAQLPFHQSHLLREETLSTLKILTSGRKIFFLSGHQVPSNAQPAARWTEAELQQRGSQHCRCFLHVCMNIIRKKTES